MYVSVVCDLNSDNSKRSVDNILMEYGFKKCQRDVYENISMTENLLSRLKLDIDRHCDSYDQIRIYQYPLDHSLVISHLYEKRWKKKIVQDKSIKKG